MSGAETSSIYVFGDQTYNYEHSLAQLLRSDDVHLNWFFRCCYEALGRELGRLPPHRADSTPKHASIGDVLARKRDGVLSVALEQWLSVVHNISLFIWQHTYGKTPYPTSQNSQLLGFCTGSFAAAAVSSAESLDELIYAGVHASIVAFHTGLFANDVRNSAAGANAAAPWSMIVHNASSGDFAKVLEEFNQRKPRPAASHAYISSTSASSSTVSAPPDVLDELAQDPAISSRQNAALSIYAPYHAPHLYSSGDVDSILAESKNWAPHATANPIPVLSCGSGHAVWVTTSQAMLESAVHDVLTRPMLVEKTIESVASAAKNGSANQIFVVPIGTETGGTVKRRVESALSGRENAKVELTVPSQPPRPVSPHGRSKIAIIGYSGRFPGASDSESLWQLLQDKVDMVREVPKFRWDPETHVDPSGKAKNTSKVRWGCWLDDPDLFDASFFSISPREAPQVDPAQRLALMTAYEAIEMAGVVPGRTPSTREDRVGVFYGVTSNDWCEANSGQDIDTYYIPGANRAFIPGRVNYFFKFSGPSYACDTACSSSLSAIHIACNSLWQRDTDMAIAGGTNVLTNPDMTTGLDKGHFLSTTGNCKTFDESADGYCRGEGVATVILKRLEDAIEDHDPIFAVLGSAFTNHSAEAESITRPHVGAQKDIFERVLSSGGIHPYDVDYIEMHGTGTQAGDTREINSVCDTFAPTNKPHKRPADQPLHLGALKSNIGHGESVSGVSAMIKVIMMMKKGEIPPHCGIKTRLNPNFPSDLEERNVHIDLESTPWPRSRGQPRRALINNFSAAGGNTSVLLEEPPTFEAEVDYGDARTLYPVSVSARSTKSLKANVEAISAYLSNGGVALPALSYTTTARRMPHHFRLTVVAENIDSVKSQLKKAVDDGLGNTRIKPPKQMLFAFTGQGSQYPGMGKQLLDTLAAFREQITHFDNLAQRLGLPGFLSLMQASRGNDIASYPPVVVQLANTCMQIALARIWISWGINPTAVVGHSLGEYAALNIAGVLSDSDTVFLVGRRAQLLQEKCEPGSHAMLAVAKSVDELQSALPGVEFEVACINGPQETVLGGKKNQVKEWKDRLTEAGVKNTLLQVPYAFHTSQVEPICEAYRKEADGVVFSKPQIPVLSPLHGSVVQEEGVFGPEYVVRHAREPVRIMDSLNAASKAKVLTETSYGIEYGPHPVVSGMIKSTLGPKMKLLPTLRNKSKPWEILAQTLSSLHDAGVSVKWDGYFADVPSAKVVLPLPAYNWELKSYWIRYRNDWTLTKGDIPLNEPIEASERRSIEDKKSSQPAAAESKQPAPAQEEKKAPKLESSSIQKVLSEDVTQAGYKVVIECDANREDVKPFIQSHTVDGYSLCTPAVYADISMYLGSYVLERFSPSFSEKQVSVNNMDIKRALIGNADWKQWLRCTAEFNWEAKKGDLKFGVHDETGAEVGVCATCDITFVDNSDYKKLRASLPAFKENLQRMRNGLTEGKTSRVSGDMSYRLVSGLADFNPDYHCVDEVLYDDDKYECIQTVSFGQMKQGGDFFINPGVVDGLTQAPGFTMNANSKTKLDTDVFVNHGWKEFLLYQKIRNDCNYRSHVIMEDTGHENLWTGEVHVFEGENAVALVKGVQIQGVQRRFLKYILSQAAKPPKSVKSNAAPKQDAPKEKAAAPEKKAAAPEKKAPAPAPKKEEPKAAAPSAPADDGQLAKALAIIAEQSGVELSDLTDDTLFTDLGVDSLLSLMITSQFAEDLGVNADPTFFDDHQSVADVKKFFSAGSSTSAPEPAEEQEEGPAPGEEIPSSEPEVAPQANSGPEKATPAPEYTDDAPPSDGQFAAVLQVIADEVQVPVDELKDDSMIADLGIDSLLSLMIGSRFRDELDIEFDTQNMAELENLGALRKAMFPAEGAGSSTTADSSDSSSPVADSAQPETPPSEVEELNDNEEEVPKTSSVVLQGNSKNAKDIFWIFPDGSGLASSYVNLPRIHPDLVVYGMNSPYLKKGVEMNCTWDAMVKSYIAEVKRRQPSGPYSFAGWSAGGILAYRASQMLMDAGDEVRDLIILDSPPPFGLKLLPEHFFEYCSTAGLLGGNNGAPDWLIAHFRSINKVLQSYFAQPLTKSTLRKVNILWACESSVDDSFYGDSDDPEDMKFLTVKRTDYSPGKWEPLFKENVDVPIKVDLAEGQHHWSLLKGESAKKVADYMRNILYSE